MAENQKENINLVEDEDLTKSKPAKGKGKKKPVKQGKKQKKKIKKAEKKLLNAANTLVLTKNEIALIAKKIIRLRKNIADGKAAALPRIKMRRLRARLKLAGVQLKEERGHLLKLKAKIVKRKKKIRQLKSGK